MPALAHGTTVEEDAVRPRFVLMLALSCAPAIGCVGPIAYMDDVTFGASKEVAAAKAAGADKYTESLYDYTMAVEFLHKAREEAGYSDYQAASRFGDISSKHARLARKEALEVQGHADMKPGEAPIDPSSPPPQQITVTPDSGDADGGGK